MARVEEIRRSRVVPQTFNIFSYETYVMVAELKGVCKSYPMVTALEKVDIKIKEKELLILMGPSGSGKSTLLHIAGILDTPTKGKVYLMGKQVPRDENKRAKLRSEFIGFIFQDFGLITSLNARDNILLPTLFSGISAEKRLDEIAEKLGITNRLHHYPKQLSGGEKQRVAIARSLINDPKLIFADEPTGNLDSKTGDTVMKLLRGLADSGKSVIVVTHNSEHEKYADRIVKMRDGKLL